MPEQTIEIKAKFSKGDLLFALKKGEGGEPNTFIPVKIDCVKIIRFLGFGQSDKKITYYTTPCGKGGNLDVDELDLYTAEEMARFLK